MESLPLPKKSLALFNITTEGYHQVQKLGLLLDQIFYLECLSNNINLSEFDKPKITAIRASLTRKGYILPSGKISQNGDLLLQSLSEGTSFEGMRVEKVTSIRNDFDKWWITFPAIDAFSHKGKEFAGSRTFRTKKDECRTKFYRILEDKEYTADDLIRALEYEILMRKENSIVEKDNKLKYMLNTLSYLNQRIFENFIEISKTKMKETGIQNNTIDI